MHVDVELITETKGFLDEEEGRALYDLAIKAAPLGPCLEIGSYCGKSALYLGPACKEKSAILFSVDHHCGSEEQQPGEEYYDPELFDPRMFAVDTLYHFRSTLRKAGLEETVVPVVAASNIVARAWNTALSLIFIDGGHAYETVLADYNNWAGQLMTGGYLLFHDIFKNPEDGGQAPYRVFQKAISSGDYEQLPMVKSLGVLQKI